MSTTAQAWPCKADGTTSTVGVFLGAPAVRGLPDVPAVRVDTNAPLAAADVSSSSAVVVDKASGSTIQSGLSFAFLRSGIFVCWLPAGLSLTVGQVAQFRGALVLANGLGTVNITQDLVLTVYTGD